MSAIMKENQGLWQIGIIVGTCNSNVPRDLTTMQTTGQPDPNKLYHNGFALITDGKSFDNGVRANSEEKLYKCSVCQKAFEQRSYVKIHMKTHTEEKPHKCPICAKDFSLSRYLNYHLKIHSGEKPFKCELCEKSFATNTKLISHARIHSGEKPYKCSICGKAVKRPYELRMHMRTHTGEKPYKCQLCNNSYASTSHLNSHMKTHTGERPYKCKLCHKAFAWKSALKKHSETHHGDKSYKGQSCAKGFEQSDGWTERRHTRDKPHKSVDRLFHHARTHMQEEQNLEVFERQTSSVAVPFLAKSYGCVICNEMFQIEKEFTEHCFRTCYSPVDKDFVELFDD